LRGEPVLTARPVSANNQAAAWFADRLAGQVFCVDEKGFVVVVTLARRSCIYFVIVELSFGTFPADGYCIGIRRNACSAPLCTPDPTILPLLLMEFAPRKSQPVLG